MGWRNGPPRRTRKLLPIFEPFAVVRVPYPFTEHAMQRRRPALVLSASRLRPAHRNRLRVVRPVCYSTRNENCFDLVLCLKGILVATAELKTDNTQSINDAVWHYKSDRNPKPAGQQLEPLLSFPGGALKRCC